MNKYKIKEVIVVEGTYDKVRLGSFIDGIIFVTGGFSIMSGTEKIESLLTLAEKTGIVILTDSDSAGFRIRNYIKQKIPQQFVKNAFVPDIAGKERRKRVPGKEGLLGVEGMSEEIIIDALSRAGCNINGTYDNKKNYCITKADLFMLGISGRDDSKKKKVYLMDKLGLPSKMSSNMLCKVLSEITTLNELKNIVENIPN